MRTLTTILLFPALLALPAAADNFGDTSALGSDGPMAVSAPVSAEAPEAVPEMTPDCRMQVMDISRSLERQAYGGAETQFRDYFEQGCPDYHLVQAYGAQAQTALGDAAERFKRLSRASALCASAPEYCGQSSSLAYYGELKAFKRAYGTVMLSIERRDRRLCEAPDGETPAPLAPERPSFEPDKRSAVAYANRRLCGGDYTFSGFLPAGNYTLGGQAVRVEPRG